jgi:DNA-binding NarL/FixJ family response regulator
MEVVVAMARALPRAGLLRLLVAHQEVHRATAVAPGQALLQAVAKQHPALLLFEFDRPQIDDMELLGQLRRHYPEVAVVLMAGPASASHLRPALRQGAAGVLDLDAEPEELALLLKAVSRQQIYISASLAHLMIGRRAGLKLEDSVVLTPRQRQVLQMIGRGKSTKEIAALMGVGVKTVETHRARLMSALGLYGTNALMRYAIRHSADSH